MKKFFETLKNIWMIEDLRMKILITLGFAAIYRFGSFVVLPGINPNHLAALREQTNEGLMSLLNMFSGGAFSNASIFGLGIMPYISASIVIQLLAVAVPYFQKMQREGESGRRKINQYTRYLTIFILLFQAPAYLTNLKQVTGGALNPAIGWTSFMISSTIILAAGSMFILWLGERITDKGIGNGVSLIIMLGIIARLPQAFGQEAVSRLNNLAGGGLVMFIVELFILFLVIMAAIMLVQGTRKVPVQYAKRVMGGQQIGGARQYLPLKLFAANVMPIIFAQAIMFIPITLLNYFGDGQNPSAVLIKLSDHTSWAYNLVLGFQIDHYRLIKRDLVCTHIAAMNTARLEQAVVMAHEQVTLNLLQRIEHHTHQDEEGCAAEELCKLRGHLQQAGKSRHTCNSSQEERTRQCDM